MSEERTVEMLGVVVTMRNRGTPVAVRSVATSDTKDATIRVTYIFTFVELRFLDVVHC